MLEKLFTSKTRVKILELLLFTHSQLHLREIARRISISPAYVGRELENLLELNLVKKTKMGNLDLFEINKNSPIYEEIKKIFLKTESLGSYLKGEFERMGNIKYAMIYGSFASGRETKKSDIDLLIVGDVPEEELLKLVGDIENKLSREINYIYWKEKEFLEKAKERHHLLNNIVKNPIIGIVGDMDEFRRIIEE